MLTFYRICYAAVASVGVAKGMMANMHESDILLEKDTVLKWADDRGNDTGAIKEEAFKSRRDRVLQLVGSEHKVYIDLDPNSSIGTYSTRNCIHLPISFFFSETYLRTLKDTEISLTITRNRALDFVLKHELGHLSNNQISLSSWLNVLKYPMILLPIFHPYLLFSIPIYEVIDFLACCWAERDADRQAFERCSEDELKMAKQYFWRAGQDEWSEYNKKPWYQKLFYSSMGGHWFFDPHPAPSQRIAKINDLLNPSYV